MDRLFLNQMASIEVKSLKQWQHHQDQELHGLPPRQVLWRRLPEGPPQAA